MLCAKPKSRDFLTPYLILLSINYTEIRNVNHIFSAFEYHSNRINKSQSKPSEMIPTLDRHWYTCWVYTDVRATRNILRKRSICSRTVWLWGTFYKMIKVEASVLVSVKKGREYSTGAPEKPSNWQFLFKKIFDSKFSFKSIILVWMAFNF